MEQASSVIQQFNNVFKNQLKINNKYVLATVMVLLAIYAGAYAPKLPEFLVKLLDNIFVKIILMFLILHINLGFEPSLSVIIAVLIAVVMLALTKLKDNKKIMSLFGKNKSVVVPLAPAIPQQPLNDRVDFAGETHAFVDGPVSSVSDAEMESLCMHLPKNASSEIMTGSGFSEIMSGSAGCDFAPHQFEVDKNSPFTSDNKMFSELAPAN